MPHMYPPLKIMFADHCEELEFRVIFKIYFYYKDFFYKTVHTSVNFQAEKRALKRNHSLTEKDPKKSVLRKNKYKMKNL